VTVNDINTLLARRIMVGSDCNRPAETDVERLQWLTGTTEQSFIDDATTFLDTSGPVNMDAADYRYQYANQIYDDCSQASGKNYFLYPYFDSTWKVGFWYEHSDESTDYSSDIQISNDASDIDYSTTFEAKIDTTLTRDPSRVYSGVAMPFDGGTQYSQRASTISVFAARDTSAPMVNVKTYTKAQARALRYLDTIKTEEDIIETGLYLPPEQVNDVLVGQRMQAKFTHLPGYEDFSWMRVLKKTTTFLTPWLYDVDLTLSGTASNASPYSVVYVGAFPYGGHPLISEAAVSIEASDDGVTWTVVVPTTSSGSIEPNLWAVPAPDQGHRYWSMRYLATHTGGFYGGFNMKAIRLLNGAGVDALGTAGTDPSLGPPIPWQLVSPTLLPGGSVPYVATSNPLGFMYGNYLTVHFNGQTPGPTNGDYTYDNIGEVDSSFGLGTGVLSAGVVDTRWVWDLGA
jgi:hypothetical protein